MPLQERGVMTRAAAAAAAAALGHDPNQTEYANQLLQAPPGKRGQRTDADKGPAGSSKKGRSAFGDITNRGRHAAARQAATKAEPLGRATQSVPVPDVQQACSTNPFDRVREARTSVNGPYSSRYQPASSTEGLETAQPSAPRVIDIDANSTILGCPDYVVPIFEHLRAAERFRRPTPNYLDSVQSDVTINMRHTLVDWLVEVSQEYRLVSDTLFLAISYIDRYLSLVPVPRSQLQLVGVTCLLVASKYEEIYAPQVDQFVYITDNTYTREEVLQMEQQVLAVLDFGLTAPTAKTFLRRFVQAAMAGTVPDARLEHLAAYLVELALCEYGSLQFLPSNIAAAAVLVAQYSLGLSVWSPTLEHYSGYSQADLQIPSRMLHHLALAAYTQAPPPASREKFASNRYKQVSLLRPPDTLPSWLFIEL